MILGSGIDTNNISGFYHEADGFIVGSYFKLDGHWANAIDPSRVERFMTTLNRFRTQLSSFYPDFEAAGIDLSDWLDMEIFEKVIDTDHGKGFDRA